jgi:hypothetical protein
MLSVISLLHRRVSFLNSALIVFNSFVSRRSAVTILIPTQTTSPNASILPASIERVGKSVDNLLGELLPTKASLL